MDGDHLAVEHFGLAERVANSYCSIHGIPNSWRDDVLSWAQYGLLRAARKWNGEGVFRAYARRTIKNTIIDHLRVALGRRGQHVAFPVESSILELVGCEDHYEDVDQLDFVERLRSILEPRDFDFVVTAEFAEYKQDVARLWGVSPGRLSQIRTSEKIREALAPYFGKAS